MNLLQQLKQEQKELREKMSDLTVLINLLWQYDLITENDKLIEKIKQKDIGCHMRLKEIENELGHSEEKLKDEAIQMINEKWLDKELDKDKQFELLQSIRNLFNRKNCNEYSNGLKSWILYLGEFETEYSKEKDENDWVNLTIKIKRGEKDGNK